ncbi:MAG: hypothetical protein E6I76_09360 [Chloroflexi bacterium]|nr:MAG: hypothetical protein E6I76_09360 [Chloroflexota bacterium]
MADAPLAVVLAAGRGTRMRSRTPKALHPLAGRPLLLHVVAAAAAATGTEPLVVVSPEHPEVAAALDGVASTAEQAQARGTGDALPRCCAPTPSPRCSGGSVRPRRRASSSASSPPIPAGWAGWSATPPVGSPASSSSAISRPGRPPPPSATPAPTPSTAPGCGRSSSGSAATTPRASST